MLRSAPTIAELLKELVVIDALETAWLDSNVNDSANRHEEGGWVYVDVSNGAIATRRCPAGGKDGISLKTSFEIPGLVVVATFHTHPNPSAEGWEPGPSLDDTREAFIDGVPCLIRADDGIHSTGPSSRRGGLIGVAGFPR